jgi:membrane-associated phospholipid phosphatase
MLLSNIWPMEIPITLFFQNLGAWLTPIMQSFSFLGNEMFFLIIMTGLYWCIDSALGIRVGMALLSTTSLNSWLKMSIRGARPYWYSDKVIGYVHEPSFGFPSGHAQMAVSVWGRISIWFKKAWVWIVCIVIILVNSISRIYLGAHFSSDVLAGWLVGAVFLIVFILLEKPVSRWWLVRKFSTQVILAFMLSLALIAINLLLISYVARSDVPAEWTSTAKVTLTAGGVDAEGLEDLKTSIVSESYQGAYSNAGIIFGMLTGISMLKKLGGFTVARKAISKFFSYILGLAGVLILYLGLKLIIPDNMTYFSMMMRYYLRYILIGLWVSLVAPLLFIKFGWATTELDQKSARKNKIQDRETVQKPKHIGGEK